MGSHLTCGKRSTDCVQDNLGKVKVSLGLLDLFDNNFNLFFKDTFFQDLCYLVQIAIESFWMHTHLQKCSLPGKVSFSLVLFKIGIYLAVQSYHASSERPRSILKRWTLLKCLPYCNPGLPPPGWRCSLPGCQATFVWSFPPWRGFRPARPGPLSGRRGKGGVVRSEHNIKYIV